MRGFQRGNKISETINCWRTLRTFNPLAHYYYIITFNNFYGPAFEDQHINYIFDSISIVLNLIDFSFLLMKVNLLGETL